MNQQHALWYSGLRGAMAFALALQSITDLPDGHGRILFTSTLFTIFFTVLFVGGTTPDCLTYFNIEMTRSSAGHGEPEANVPMPATTHVDTPVEGSDDESEAGDLGILERHKAKLQKKLRKLKKDADFAKLDKKYIKPFFTSPTDSRPTSPRSPDCDVTSEVNLTKLPARANERRSLVADAFYARTDPFPISSPNRKLSKVASGGNKQVDSSWSVAPGRRRSTQELETWYDDAATIPSVPTEQSFHAVEIKTTNSPGVQEVLSQRERKKPHEVSWPSAGGWATNVKSLDPRGVMSLQAELQLQHMTRSPKSPSSRNPGEIGDRCKMHPTAHLSVGSDFASIDLT
ncbi:hypothetical protein R1sor_022983 [Riccia sorocarpa]|uniref:Cation/H+ exchanger domain-containing protein n=1 Tax=Riccia sorocarpa TaxID=122646 RepID=A0ABD3GLF3_9MARC